METKTGKLATTTLKNTKRLALWTLAWVLTMAVAAFGPKLLWDFNTTISAIFIGVNTLIGVGMIQANRRYLNGLDEMQRKISLEAMAIALGVGLVGGLSYGMLDIANVVSFHAEIGHLVILIGVTYLVAIVVGNLRYK